VTALAATLLLTQEPVLAFPPRIVLVGDSIVVGGHIEQPRRTFSHLLQRAGIRVHDISRNGARATVLLPVLPPLIESLDGLDAASGNLAAVVVMLGTNDYARSEPVAGFVATWQAFALSVRAPVYCVTPIWRFGEKQRNDVGLVLEDYRRAIRTWCPGEVIEGSALLPGDSAAAALLSPSQFLIDGIHLNRLGHRRVYWNLHKILAARLRQPATGGTQ